MGPTVIHCLTIFSIEIWHRMELNSRLSTTCPFLALAPLNVIHDRSSGRLTHLTSESVLSPQAGGPEANDDPRHVKAHFNFLYCVTMTQTHHFDRNLNLANLVDSYKILSMSVEYIASLPRPS